MGRQRRFRSAAGSLSSNYQPVFYPARHSRRPTRCSSARSSSRRSGFLRRRFASTAAALAAGGADLIKDDELLGDPEWCPLEERVRAVAAVLPDGVRYAANVTGPVESLLQRARRVVELGAGAVMVNAFAQGLDSLRALREAELGVPIFAHRVGAALWARERGGWASLHAVIARSRGCAAPTSSRSARSPAASTTRPTTFTHRSTPATARVSRCADRSPSSAEVSGRGMLERKSTPPVCASGLMVLLGSAAYEDGSPEEAVRATVESVRPNSAAESA